MYCTKCGHRINENSKFCGNCGQSSDEKIISIKTESIPISKKSWPLVLTLSILTFGYYQIYWYYQVSNQVKKEVNKKYNPTLRALLLIIPLVSWFIVYYLAGDISDLQKKAKIKGIISPGFILVIAIFTKGLFYPAILQNAFNNYVTHQREDAVFSKMTWVEWLILIFAILFWGLVIIDVIMPSYGN